MPSQALHRNIACHSRKASRLSAPCQAKTPAAAGTTSRTGRRHGARKGGAHFFSRNLPPVHHKQGIRHHVRVCRADFDEGGRKRGFPCFGAGDGCLKRGYAHRMANFRPLFAQQKGVPFSLGEKEHRNLADSGTARRSTGWQNRQILAGSGATAPLETYPVKVYMPPMRYSHVRARDESFSAKNKEAKYARKAVCVQEQGKDAEIFPF